MKNSIKDLLDFISLDKLRFQLLEAPEGRIKLKCSLDSLEAGQGELQGLMIEKLSFLLDAPLSDAEEEPNDKKDSLSDGSIKEELAEPADSEDKPGIKDSLSDTTFKLEDLSVILSGEWLNSPSSRKFFKSLDLSLKFEFREGGRIHVNGFYKLFPFSGEVVLAVKGPWQLAVKIENISLLFLILIPNFLTAFIMERSRKYIQGEGLTLHGREITVDLEKIIPAKLEGSLLEVDAKDGFLYLIAGAV
ncbi:MAG: hypothetical protein V2A78_01290 [bacterium]